MRSFGWTRKAIVGVSVVTGTVVAGSAGLGTYLFFTAKQPEHKYIINGYNSSNPMSIDDLKAKLESQTFDELKKILENPASDAEFFSQKFDYTSYSVKGKKYNDLASAKAAAIASSLTKGTFQGELPANFKPGDDASNFSRYDESKEKQYFIYTNPLTKQKEVYEDLQTPALKWAAYQNSLAKSGNGVYKIAGKEGLAGVQISNGIKVMTISSASSAATGQGQVSKNYVQTGTAATTPAALQNVKWSYISDTDLDTLAKQFTIEAKTTNAIVGTAGSAPVVAYVQREKYHIGKDNYGIDWNLDFSVDPSKTSSTKPFDPANDINFEVVEGDSQNFRPAVISINWDALTAVDEGIKMGSVPSYWDTPRFIYGVASTISNPQFVPTANFVYKSIYDDTWLTSPASTRSYSIPDSTGQKIVAYAFDAGNAREEPNFTQNTIPNIVPVPQWKNGAFVLAGDDGLTKTIDNRINEGINLDDLYNKKISGQPYGYYMNKSTDKSLEPSFLTLPFRPSVVGSDVSVLQNYLYQTFLVGKTVENITDIPKQWKNYNDSTFSRQSISVYKDSTASHIKPRDLNLKQFWGSFAKKIPGTPAQYYSTVQNVPDVTNGELNFWGGGNKGVSIASQYTADLVELAPGNDYYYMPAAWATGWDKKSFNLRNFFDTNKWAKNLAVLPIATAPYQSFSTLGKVVKSFGYDFSSLLSWLSIRENFNKFMTIILPPTSEATAKNTLKLKISLKNGAAFDYGNNQTELLLDSATKFHDKYAVDGVTVAGTEKSGVYIDKHEYNDIYLHPDKTSKEFDFYRTDSMKTLQIYDAQHQDAQHSMIIKKQSGAVSTNSAGTPEKRVKSFDVKYNGTAIDEISINFKGYDDYAVGTEPTLADALKEYSITGFKAQQATAPVEWKWNDFDLINSKNGSGNTNAVGTAQPEIGIELQYSHSLDIVKDENTVTVFDPKAFEDKSFTGYMLKQNKTAIASNGTTTTTTTSHFYLDDDASMKKLLDDNFSKVSLQWMGEESTEDKIKEEIVKYLLGYVKQVS